MRMNSLMLLLVFLATVPVSAADLKLDKIEGTKPKNVVFILADDHRYDVMSFVGHPWVETPAMDALAKDGVYFQNAMVTTSLCSPSRASILTGQYMHNHGVVDNNVSAKPGTIFFPQYLQAAGYQTGFFGKWHMGGHSDAPRPGFDKWVSFRGQGHYYPPKHLKKWSLNVDGKSVPQKGYITDELTDYAINWLNKSVKPKDKPFFMYLAFACPHDPRVADQEYLDLYRREQIELPKNYLPLHPFNNGEQIVRDELLAGFPRSEAEVRKHLHDYYADITGLDAHIGRLLKALKASGEYENTVIIFSSDHGLALGSHGLMGKQSLYEHSMKSPLIFSGPGIPHGSSDALVYLYDIFPTVCEMVGTEVPQGLDAESVWPVISGTKPQIRETLFTSYKDVQRSVRDERWKLITYPQINVSQLFDLKNDPEETKKLVRPVSLPKSFGPLVGCYERLAEKGRRYQLFDIGDTSRRDF